MELITPHRSRLQGLTYSLNKRLLNLNPEIPGRMGQTRVSPLLLTVRCPLSACYYSKPQKETSPAPHPRLPPGAQHTPEPPLAVWPAGVRRGPPASSATWEVKPPAPALSSVQRSSSPDGAPGPGAMVRLVS